MYYEERFEPANGTWWFRTSPRGAWSQMNYQMVCRKLYDLKTSTKTDEPSALESSANNEVVNK